MNRGFHMLLGFGLACGATVAAAQLDEPAPAPYAGDEIYFSVLANGLVSADEDHVPDWDTGIGGDLRLGWRPADWGFGFEVRGFYTRIEMTDPAASAGNRYGIGGDVLFWSPEFFGITPYLLAGFGIPYADKLPIHDQIGQYFNAGAGLTTGVMRLFDIPFRARLEGRWSRDDYTIYYSDVYAFAGLDIPFGGTVVMAEPEPEPVAVVEPIEPEPVPAPQPAPAPAPQPTGPVDSDEDGVYDNKDRCPNSPTHKPVDQEGCTIIKVLTLEGVNFESGSDRLKPESIAVLDEAVQKLKDEFPEARIEVAGHTDSVGNEGYNKRLSLRRANAVMKHLVRKGIDARRLSAAGYGESEPVADDGTPEGKAQNRRVELRVKGEVGPEPVPLSPRGGY